MGEKEYLVQPFEVIYICDICGEGEMKQTGTMISVSPPEWGHRCNNCGCTHNMLDQYPTIRYKRI